MEIFLQVLIQGLLIGAIYAVIALGMTVVFSITGLLNFAHGDFMILAMYLALSFSTAWGLDPYISMAITFPILLIVGAVVFQFLIRPIMNQHILMVAQLTLGLVFMLQSGLLMTYGGEYQRVKSVVGNARIFLGEQIIIRSSMLYAAIGATILTIAFFWVLQKTDFGRSVRAVHQNRNAAALMGVNVPRVQLIVFAVGVGVLAIAGSLLLPFTPIHPNMGLSYTLITFIIIVLGTMGNFLGTLIGGLIIGVAEAMGSVYVSGSVGMLIPYIIFVAILLFRPQGIMGDS